MEDQNWATGGPNDNAMIQTMKKVGVTSIADPKWKKYYASTQKRSGGGGGAPATPASKGKADEAYGRLNALVKPTEYVDSYADRLNTQYSSKYIPQIDNLLDRLQNRQAFSYNASADPLYRQYAARYQQQARQAMQDTMGQAAGLTGGYGSSYAQAAGNQAYQQQMAGLNDRMLELYDRAKSRYDREGDDMRSNLSALETRENANRGMFESDRSDLRTAQQHEYQQYLDRLNQYNADRNMLWDQYQYWYTLASQGK